MGKISKLRKGGSNKENTPPNLQINLKQDKNFALLVKN